LTKISHNNINLGGDAIGADDKAKLVVLPSPDLRSYSHRDVNSPLPCEWRTVAEACQSLQSLRGLRIDAPSFTDMWITLSLYEAEELEDLGMNGRPNVLKEVHGGVWELLEREW
jgi:hypothetical protein